MNRKTYQNLPLLICVEFAHKKNQTTDLPIYQGIAPLTIETNSLHAKNTTMGNFSKTAPAALLKIPVFGTRDHP
jgi:hypothetical protein